MVPKVLYQQYLRELSSMFLQKILDNKDKFTKDLLPSIVTEAYEFWFNEKGLMVMCEFDRQCTGPAYVDIDKLSEWMEGLDDGS